MITYSDRKVVKIEGIMHGNQRQAVFQWAYIAGLIDGEGSFVISKTKVENIAKRSQCKSDRYLAYFCIGMVDREPLGLIVKMIGCGKVYEERVPDRRSIWRVRFGGRLRLIPFIENLLPYLIVKRKQAETVLEFCKSWIQPFNKQQGVSERELQRREEAYQKMRKLNAVGAAATTKSLSTRECEAIV